MYRPTSLPSEQFTPQMLSNCLDRNDTTKIMELLEAHGDFPLKTDFTTVTDKLITLFLSKGSWKEIENLLGFLSTSKGPTPSRIDFSTSFINNLQNVDRQVTSIHFLQILKRRFEEIPRGGSLKPLMDCLDELEVLFPNSKL